MPADMGGGNLSDIHRVTLFLRSTFYHFTPPKVQFYFETDKKIGKKFQKNGGCNNSNGTVETGRKGVLGKFNRTGRNI